MTSLHRRLRQIEAVFRPAPKPGSDPNSVMQRQALACLSIEDLIVLSGMSEQGKEQSGWTDRESHATKALTSAFKQQVQQAGYRSIRELQRSL